MNTKNCLGNFEMMMPFNQDTVGECAQCSNMSPVSLVFHTAVTVSIGLKHMFRVGTY